MRRCGNADFAHYWAIAAMPSRPSAQRPTQKAPARTPRGFPKVLISQARLQRRLRALAAEIEANHPKGKRLTVVLLLDGALFFAADLLRHLKLDLEIITLRASSYHGARKSSGLVKLDWPRGLSLRGRHVLLLDDILDTGLTLSAVRARLSRQRPASLQLAVLLAKRRHREAEVAVDYCGFEIPDVFVVGYGMDDNGLHRQWPLIAQP